MGTLGDCTVMTEYACYNPDNVGCAVNQLAEVDYITALHGGEVIPAVLPLADLEGRMDVRPVRRMVEGIVRLVPDRMYAQPLKESGYRYRLDFREVISHGSVLYTVKVIGMIGVFLAVLGYDSDIRQHLRQSDKTCPRTFEAYYGIFLSQ